MQTLEISILVTKFLCHQIENFKNLERHIFENFYEEFRKFWKFLGIETEINPLALFWYKITLLWIIIYDKHIEKVRCSLRFIKNCGQNQPYPSPWSLWQVHRNCGPKKPVNGIMDSILNQITARRRFKVTNVCSSSNKTLIKLISLLHKIQKWKLEDKPEISLFFILEPKIKLSVHPKSKKYLKISY